MKNIKKVLIGMSSSLLAVLVLAASAAYAAPSGLIARYHLNTINNNTIRDTSGNNLNGNIVGSVALVTGKFGNAYSFAGAGYGMVPNNTLLEPGSISVEAWVKAAGSPGVYKYVVSKGIKGINNASYAIYTGASGGLSFYISDNTAFYLSPDAGTGIWDGNWHQVTGTYDGTTVRLYVDGKEIGTGTPIITKISYGLPDGNNLLIGNYNGTATYAFIGQIDEIRIWNVALSPDIIYQHANSNSISTSTSLESEVESEY